MEDLKGWRILSTVDQIIPGVYAKTSAKKWRSDYASEFLMLEMMAQTGGLIIGAACDFQGNVVFAKVESTEFLTRAEGVSSSEFSIEAFARDGVGEQGSWIEAHVLEGDQKVAQAKLFLIDAGDLSGSSKSLTFHSDFLEYYQVRQKIQSKQKSKTEHVE